MNTNIKKILTIGLIIAIFTAIPIALGAIGDNVDKVRQHRDTAIKGLYFQAVELCEWQEALVLENNKVLTKADDILANAKELQKVQLDCQSYAIEQLTKSFQKTK